MKAPTARTGPLGIPSTPLTIGVIGDFFVDRYWLGTTTRLSPEAAVPVVAVGRMLELDGGAGNVAENLRALGAHVLTAHTEAAFPVKNRLYVGTQQIARWDEHDVCTPIRRRCVEALSNCARLVIADYGKGSIDIDVLETAWKLGIPTFVDTKSDPNVYVGWATAIFPNACEYAAHASSFDLFERCVVTGGPNGLEVREFGRIIESLPAYCKHPLSVCGAGDTVTAAYAYAWPAARAVEFASIAAAVVVSKPFTAVASLEEVHELRKQLNREREKEA